jgi:lysozyme
VTTGPDGVGIIKEFELLCLAPYRCPAGLPTCGYGHTAGVSLNDPPCTPEKAEAWLREDLDYAEGLIARHVTAPLTQPQYDALASLIFNVGPGRRGLKDGIIELKAGGQSTLLKHLNAGDYAGAGQQVSRWVWATVDGKLTQLPGLVRRRAAERALFESG